MSVGRTHSQERPRESRSACVPVVKSTDSRKRNDPTALDRFDLATVRRSLIERLVNPILVIITHVASEQSLQVLLVEHDDVIETLPADGTDDPFDVRILPGALGCVDDLSDSHCFHPSDELVAVDPVTSTQQVPRSFVPRERLRQLSSGPLCAGIRRDRPSSK